MRGAHFIYTDLWRTLCMRILRDVGRKEALRTSTSAPQFGAVLIIRERTVRSVLNGPSVLLLSLTLSCPVEAKSYQTP